MKTLDVDALHRIVNSLNANRVTVKMKDGYGSFAPKNLVLTGFECEQHVDADGNVNFPSPRCKVIRLPAMAEACYVSDIKHKDYGKLVSEVYPVEVWPDWIELELIE